EVALTGSALSYCDYDQDGDIDLFLGGRTVPRRYGEIPDSYLLKNNGKGKFEDVTDQVEGLRNIGMLRSAEWGDIDGNGKPDLVLAGEWMPLSIFLNQGGKLTQIKPKGLEQSHGWWNTIKLVDIDKDGDLDILGGNLGLNSKLKADSEHPLRLAVRDFDQNGSLDQLLLHHWQGEERLFATKDELGKQLVALNKKFVSYRDYSKASFKEIIDPVEFAQAAILQAYELRSCLFLNDGQGVFMKQVLPQSLQISTLQSFTLHDMNGDGLEDIFAFGNFHEINIQMGRYDASYGHLLWNRKGGQLEASKNREINLYAEGQVRRSRKLRYQNRWLLILARNNDALSFIALDSDEQVPSLSK
ncbi:MAG: VCBS repeat-containing protein, partial [Bacteroidota bacterium]